MKKAILLAAAVLGTAAVAQSSVRPARADEPQMETKAPSAQPRQGGGLDEETYQRLRYETLAEIQGQIEKQRTTALTQAETTLKRLQGEAVATTTSPAVVAFTFPGIDSDKRIDLDFGEVSVRDAIKKVVELGTKDVETVIDADVAADTRVTLRAKGVRFSTAMDLLAQAAGASWRLERRNGKTSLRVGKALPGAARVLRQLSPGTFDFRLATPSQTAPDGLFRSYYSTRERRLIFNCPHCKGRTSLVRVEEQPVCPKCSRTFQSDWQYCPADGAKRPASKSDFQYCPLCGKRVNTDHSDATLTPAPVFGIEPVIEEVHPAAPAAVARPAGTPSAENAPG